MGRKAATAARNAVICMADDLKMIQGKRRLETVEVRS
jgi:hypothetical protein